MQKYSEQLKLILVATGCWSLALAIPQLHSHVLGVFAKFQPYVLSSAFFGLGIGYLCRHLHPRENDGEPSNKPPLWAILLIVNTIIAAAIFWLGYPDGMGTALQSILMNEYPQYIYFPKFLKERFIPEVLSTFLLAYVFASSALIQVPFGIKLRKLATEPVLGQNLLCISLGMILAWVAFTIIGAAGLPSMCMFVVALGALLFEAKPKVATIITAAVSLVLAFSTSFTRFPPDCKNNGGEAFCKSIWSFGANIVSYPVYNKDKLIATMVETNHMVTDFAIASEMTPEDLQILRDRFFTFKLFDPLYYSLPYELIEFKPRNVLIVQAGMGNEVATALAHGAEHVDAVDDRGVLMQLGDLNPAKPYQSPKVTKIVRNARIFLEETQNKYDLIVFTGPAQEKTCDFLYTVETFESAKMRLEKNGRMIVAYNMPWVRSRLAKDLKVVFEKLDATLAMECGNYMLCPKPADEKLGNQMKADFVIKYGFRYLKNQDIVESQARKQLESSYNWPFLWSASTAGLSLMDLYVLNILMVVQMSMVVGHRKRLYGLSLNREATRPILLGMAFMMGANKALISFIFTYGAAPIVTVLPLLVIWSTCAIVGLAFMKGLKLEPIIMLVASLALAILNLFCDHTTALRLAPGLRDAASAAIPLLPTLAAVLMAYANLSKGTLLSLGCMFLGFSLACTLTALPVFIGVKGLDLAVAVLFLLYLLTYIPRLQLPGKPATPTPTVSPGDAKA